MDEEYYLQPRTYDPKKKGRMLENGDEPLTYDFKMKCEMSENNAYPLTYDPKWKGKGKVTEGIDDPWTYDRKWKGNGNMTEGSDDSLSYDFKCKGIGKGTENSDDPFVGFDDSAPPRLFDWGYEGLSARPSYRNQLAAKESYFPERGEIDEDRSDSTSFVSHDGCSPLEIQRAPRASADDINYRGHQAQTSIAPLNLRHKRSVSAPSPGLVSPSLNQTEATDFSQVEPRPLPKSVSNPNVLTPVRRGTPPALREALRKSLALADKERLGTINEQEEFAQNYTVEVARDIGSPTRVSRSPLKKFFGEGGMLGRTSSSKDSPDPKYKKTGLAHGFGKLKQLLGEMGKDIVEAIPNVEIFPKGPRGLKGPSTFPISLQPFQQGQCYLQLELILTNEANSFITREYRAGRITPESILRVMQSWANKGRPQVAGFRYDMMTQRNLILANYETVEFSGPNRLNKLKSQAALLAWKSLIKALAIKTYCDGDSAVKKNVRDARKVLELIDADSTSMLTLQHVEKTTREQIMVGMKIEENRVLWNGVERRWTPSDTGPTSF